MFDLLCKKIILPLLFIALAFVANAQSSNYDNSFSKKNYYFGISLGVNQSDYKIFMSNDFTYSDSIDVIESGKKLGFNLLIITNFKIGKYMDLRFMPGLSFADRDVEYTYKDRTIVKNTIGAANIELPILFRYKSKPYKDMRLYVVGGVKYSLDLSAGSKLRTQKDLIQVAKNDFSVEYGVGAQFFFPYFIFSPEFKVSNGITDILSQDPTLQRSTVVDKLKSRMFSFSIHLEG